MASPPAVSTRLVIFDTAVVDLTEKLADPADVLFGTQLGGGTDINRAVGYCQRLVERPDQTILVLIIPEPPERLPQIHECTPSDLLTCIVAGHVVHCFWCVAPQVPADGGRVPTLMVSWRTFGMWTKGLWSVCMSLAFFGFLGVLRAAEPIKEGEPAKDRPAKADVKDDREVRPPEPKSLEPKTRPIAKGDVVARVDDIVIGRDDLEGARRLFAVLNPQAQLTGKQALEQVINRIIWSRYFEKKNLRPTADELRAAVGQLDQELRRRGTNYQEWIQKLGLAVEAHLGLLGYDLAMRKLVADIQSKIPPEEIKAEYDAHPDWYDGSRVRVSQIFVDTSNLDKAEQEKAKQRIETIYAKLPGADFEVVARDYSEAVGTGMGGDRGWFTRKGAEVDEPLMAAVWNLKAGEYTKPIQGARGWQILKVTDREPAVYTPFGCKPGILNELARKRHEALLDELKKDAKIEIYM